MRIERLYIGNKLKKSRSFQDGFFYKKKYIFIGKKLIPYLTSS